MIIMLPVEYVYWQPPSRPQRSLGLCATNGSNALVHGRKL